jgi:hypothetical protein
MFANNKSVQSNFIQTTKIKCKKNKKMIVKKYYVLKLL